MAAEPENVALDLAVEGGGDVEEKQGLLCGKQKNRANKRIDEQKRGSKQNK